MFEPNQSIASAGINVTCTSFVTVFTQSVSILEQHHYIMQCIAARMKSCAPSTVKSAQ